MIGPGERTIGGISTLVEMIVPVLRSQVDLCYFSTVVGDRPLKQSGVLSLRNILLVISQYYRFLYTLARFQPQVIHVQTSQSIAWLKDTFFILVGKTFGRQIVIHVHAADFDELYKKGQPVWQWYTSRVFNLADVVIAVSAEWRNYLATIVPVDKIYSFTNCIDVDVLSPHSSPRSSNGLTKALFLGSVGPRKGAFDLLEALGRLSSRGVVLKVWIAGYEEREGDLDLAQARLAELRLKNVCELLGSVAGLKKAQLLSEANLFVLPSYHEGLPMAILEALAAGLPVITTPVGGIPEVVRDGYNGFLIPPGDVEALAEKLAILAGDPRLCASMGKRSREIAERELDMKPYVERLVALYESIAAS